MIRNIVLSVLVFPSLLVLNPGASAAQVTGWGSTEEELLRVHISPQGGVSTNPLAPWPAVGAITPGPDGVLYAVSSGSTPHFLEVDLDSGSVTSIGPVFPGPTNPLVFMDLTSDENGTLWYVHDERLYTLDPSSGAAAPLANVPGLLRLSHFGGVLYGLLLDDLEFTVQIAEIDSAGVATPLASLPDFGVGDAAVTFPASFDFDQAGGVWIHAWMIYQIVIPHVTEPRYLFYTNPFSGAPGELQDSNGPLLNDFAVDRLPVIGVAEVPVLSLLGSLVFALGLGAAGWQRRRARSRTGDEA